MLIAAHISPDGSPAILYRRFLRGEFTLVTSPDLMQKLGEVLARRKFSPYTDQDSIGRFLWVIENRSLQVDDPPTAPTLTGDPEDDRVVALAVSAAADMIVSGDVHILDAVLPLPALRPARFLDQLGDGPTKTPPG